MLVKTWFQLAKEQVIKLFLLQQKAEDEKNPFCQHLNISCFSPRNHQTWFFTDYEDEKYQKLTSK